MPSRRSHTKSRHGCARCKQKRIKCDEARPVCGSCRKHGASCEFGDLTAATKMSLSHIVSSHGPSAINTPSSMVDSSPGHTNQNDSVTPENRELLGESQSDYSLNMRDLELMHNYTTNVYKTIADLPYLQDIWRGAVVKEAIRNPFLMHELLGVSALHLAITGDRGQWNFNDVAMRQERAMELYRPQLSNINKDNSDAIFLSTSFVSLSTFAMPLLPGTVKTPNSIIDDLIDILVYTKGITLVLYQSFGWITQGPIAPLMRLDMLKNNIKSLSAEEIDIINDLSKYNEDSSSEASVKATNSSAIIGLKEAYTMDWDDVSLPFLWPHKLGEDFHSLLRHRHPMALVLLAHYGVMMSGCDDRWWSKGWGRRAVRSVSQVIEKEWLPAIAWPLRQLGLENLPEDTPV